ncbi:MAG: hypothetical protein MUE96_06820 [Bacteroidia bacterium]|nr:hypothetical protein [Bacteroidia bacterium]
MLTTKYCYSLVFCLLLTKLLVAQHYLDTSAHWYQKAYYSGSQLSTRTHSHIWVQNDTTVMNTTYQVLWRRDSTFRTQYELDSNGQRIGIIDTIVNNQPWKLIREDGYKWYLWESGSEKVLYVFKAEKDTLVSSLIWSSGCLDAQGVYIDDVDSVCIGQSVRKRWWFSPVSFQGASSLIEGVGPNTGLLTPVCRNGCPECSYQLDLFTLNGDTIYKGNCDKVASTVTVPNKLKFQIVYKNDEIEIMNTQASTVYIYDLAGNLRSEWFTHKTSNCVIPYHQLPIGIFIVKIEAGTGYYFEKAVRLH